MSSLKEKIAEAISKHVSIEDTYTYDLKRTKSAFEVGTMSLEDFEEWTDENVEDLAETIVDALQPQLNEYQQIVLEWLKNRYTGNADPFGVAACLFSQTPRSEVIVATLKLTRDEQAQVLKIFANWTLEQVEDL